MKKLAIIGCGGIGRYHLSHFLEFHDIELAGFCDVISERAEAFVEKFGSGKAFTDYMEMYDEIKPDMVFICIPPTEHGEIEFETIGRGIPFFVEKPIALKLSSSGIRPRPLPLSHFMCIVPISSTRITVPLVPFSTPC